MRDRRILRRNGVGGMRELQSTMLVGERLMRLSAIAARLHETARHLDSKAQVDDGDFPDEMVLHLVKNAFVDDGFIELEPTDLINMSNCGSRLVPGCAPSIGTIEYAFALGALTHYTSDLAGHPAVNQAVAIQYPKLRAQFRHVRGKQDSTLED